MEFASAIASWFRTGGPFMYIILGVGVLITAFILERFWVIGRASGLNVNKLARDLEALALRGDYQGAMNLAQRVKAPAGRAAAHVLSSQSAFQGGSAQDLADEAHALVMPKLNRRLAYLGAFANVATLLGLLGTIFGLTTAFSAVSAADPAQRSTFLAAGISQALNTTSFGLIVAVPALLAHAFLSSRLERVGEQVDEIAIRLTKSLQRGQTQTQLRVVDSNQAPKAGAERAVA